MPIYLIDKIKQKNNGKFKLADAKDVETTIENKDVDTILKENIASINSVRNNYMPKHKIVNNIYTTEFFNLVSNTTDVMDGDLFVVETQDDVPPEAIARGFPDLKSGTILYGFFYNGLEESPIVIITEKGNFKIINGTGPTTCTPIGAGGGSATLPSDVVGSEFDKVSTPSTPLPSGANANWETICINRNLSADEVVNLINQVNSVGFSTSTNSELVQIGKEGNASLILIGGMDIPGVKPNFGPEAKIIFINDPDGEVGFEWSGWNPELTESVILKPKNPVNATNNSEENLKIISPLLSATLGGTIESKDRVKLYNYKDGVLDKTKVNHPETTIAQVKQEENLLNVVSEFKSVSTPSVPLPMVEGESVNKICGNLDITPDEARQLFADAKAKGLINADDVTPLFACLTNGTLPGCIIVIDANYFVDVPNATKNDFIIKNNIGGDVYYSTIAYEDEWDQFTEGWQEKYKSGVILEAEGPKTIYSGSVNVEITKIFSPSMFATQFGGTETSVDKVTLKNFENTKQSIYPKTIKSQLFEDDGITPAVLGGLPIVDITQAYIDDAVTQEQWDKIKSLNGICILSLDFDNKFPFAKDYVQLYLPLDNHITSADAKEYVFYRYESYFKQMSIITINDKLVVTHEDFELITEQKVVGLIQTNSLAKSTEDWVFTLADGTQVTKKVVLGE